MANTDYIVRGSVFPFAPVAFLAAEISPLTEHVMLTGYQPSGDEPAAGSAIMIGGEICKLVSKSGNSMDFKRGCADTIPRTHPISTAVWFLTGNVGSDNYEWGGTQQVAVKALPATASGGRVPVGGAAPNDLTFGQRFDRPYPPSNVRVTVGPDALPWFTPGLVLDDTSASLELSWVERNRVTQHDQLISYDAGSVTPEVGTTYEIHVFNAVGDLLAMHVGLTATSYSYTRTQATADFASPDIEPGFLLVYSRRDGLLSREACRVSFVLTPDSYTPAPSGMGYRLGESLGG